MSDIKMVSPLLDGYVMGEPMSSHDGVRCCPAMKENSDDKYIVKIISVPASQKQLDALLLTGAFTDAGAAMEYFKELGQGVVKEAEILQQLSKLEGFLPYDGWQMVPMEDGRLGYNVYLVGSYKRSLDKFLRRNPMTHLGAVNLGLDLCAALAICRRAGYLFIDLKPSNIYLTGEREYRIGDLGFVDLKSLKYASLPSKYRSLYTAPELHDALATLNPTADVYSLGMILYQLYNNGQLPFEDCAPSEELPAPLNADYEMAEIIMKAICPDPRSRWQNPIDMGKALVGYMQRNTVSDNPIIPPIVSQIAPPEFEEPVEILEVEDAEEIEEDLLSGNPAAIQEEDPAEELPAEEPEEVTEEIPEEEPEVPEESTEETVEESEEEIQEESQEEPEEETEEDSEIEYTPPFRYREDDFLPDDDDEYVPSDEAEPVPEEELPQEESTEEENVEEKTEIPEEPEELDFLKDMVNDETAPSVDAGDDQSDAEITDEVNLILSQADDLLAHELPDPVSISDTVRFVIPDEPLSEAAQQEEPQQVEDDEDAALFNFNPASLDADVEEPKQEEPAEVTTIVSPIIQRIQTKAQQKKKNLISWIAAIAILLVLAAAGFGCFYFYSNYYLVTIDNMIIDGAEKTMTVQVVTEADQSLLTVVCTDTYGNTFSSPVVDGKAVFYDLNTATTYKIVLEVEGFHALAGSFTGSYTTQEETNIVSFNAITGTDDGSVILNFTVDGRETQEWVMEYTAEGEDVQSVSFNGHMVTIGNLTVGKTYTFTLTAPAASELYITGNNTLEFTASSLITAKNLAIVSCEDGVLTAQWEIPHNAAVESWNVRCYSEDGYNETVTVTGTNVQFAGISTDKAYTLEVTAAGMAQSARAYITANPTTVSNIQVQPQGEGLSITWDYAGEAPETGWLMMYSMDGSNNQEVFSCSTNAATIDDVLPNTRYILNIKTADGTTVLGGQLAYTTAEAAEFSGHGVTTADLQASLCITPEVDDWTYETLDSENDYTTSFGATQRASLVVYASKEPSNSGAEIEIMYVIRDEEGNVIGQLLNTETREWKSMWNNRYAYLDIPALPTEAGSYSVEVYFNNAFVLSKNLSIIG